MEYAMREFLKAAAIGAVAAMMISAPASAQMWSSPQNTNSSSDRYVVAFPAKFKAGEIIVSFGDRRLYFIESKGRAISYPIAIPRAQDTWSGIQRVSMKRVDPSWTPTASMRRENPKLPAFVPGGHPRNPLGVRAIYLGNTLYRIHGTDAPWTIGDNVSKGCVRMHNEHVIEVYNRVAVGAKVTTTWARFTGTASPQRRDPGPASDFDPFGLFD
jgi:lipoprotein-anchoring transpeptidase ErfK/SrfK